MRKTHIIALSIIAIALLAAAIALWPSGAQAGPPAQSIIDPAAPDAPTITALVFAGAPFGNSYYQSGDTIRITVKFDRAVTVSGRPELKLNVGAHQQRAKYFHGSGARNLKFAYTVLPTDWDADGVSVPAGDIILPALSPTSLTAAAIVSTRGSVAANLTHTGLAANVRHKVQGSPDTHPIFDTAIAAQTFTRNSAITNWSLPAARGGNGALTYTLSPALPSNLTFSPATRVIAGTPTATQNAVAYTYTVTDANGDTNSLSFTIKVDGTPTFASSNAATPTAQTYAKGAAIENWTLPAAQHGNTPVTYAIAPALPDGLAFNTTTRILSGTPTATQNAATYTLTATDADGDTGTTTFTIKVDGTPIFEGDSDTLPAQTYAKDSAITAWIMPAATDGNKPLTYSLSPAPPAGLAFDAATHSLSGTPTATQNAGDFTYTVTDADGDKDELTFTITVDGTPTFGEQTVAAETYVRNVAIDDLQLPQATDGNTPLTYSLTTPPAGLAFNAATRTLSGTPTAQQTATAYTYTVTDADGDKVTLTFNIAVIVDYDADDDQLIEVDSLAKLNAIRWDLDGNGVVDTGTSDADTAKYNAAYSDAPAGMGCKLVDHDDNAATDKTPVCIGYELVKDLDFDTDDDGATYTVSSTGVVTGDSGDAYYNGGTGWNPIGTHTWNSGVLVSDAFNAIFDGNGKTISNLFIKDAVRVDLGLFGHIGRSSGRVERLGVLNLNVSGVGGGLAGRNMGTITASYSTGSVTTSGGAGGLVGHNAGGTITTSYANVSVSGGNATGGLVGSTFLGTISNSYATGSVSGNDHTGGLVGENYAADISASYATGSVSGNNGVGGLVGASHTEFSWYETSSRSWVDKGTISTSYATGSVSGNRAVGGLLGGFWGGVGYVRHSGSSDSSYAGTVTKSYWDMGTTGQTASAGGTGKTTSELQSFISISLGGGWSRGTTRQYPVLGYGGLDPAKQRQTSIQSDNWNAPVVGEPVTAGLHIDGNPTATWKWQSSADGATWTNITGATTATYIPVASDAASGGKFLRAQATFTVSGSSQTLTTVNTAKVVAASTATASATLSVTPVVGVKLRYDNAAYVAAGAANRTAWRWQRCDDAAMTTNCKFRASSEPADNAYTEYTPAAGTDTDVGKYLQAYVYYTDTANSNAWTRTQTPILGPVVAAAPAPTTP